MKMMVSLIVTYLAPWDQLQEWMNNSKRGILTMKLVPKLIQLLMILISKSIHHRDQVERATFKRKMDKNLIKQGIILSYSS
jgi:hypothetical protein